jgi:hypothetical protein
VHGHEAHTGAIRRKTLRHPQRLFLFARDVVNATQNLHTRGKEARLRLRMQRATGFLDERHEPLVTEATALTKIVATIIRNSERRQLPRLRSCRVETRFGIRDSGFGI